MPLSDLTILITSFLRPGYLAECLKGIRKNLPECQIVVVDDSKDIVKDGYSYGESHPVTTFPEVNKNETYIELPFDSGLPAKRNAGAKAIKTKYMLMGTDDFDFGTPEARAGVIKLLDTMEAFPKIDVAGGHFNNQPYEGFLELVPGSHIKETRLFTDPTPWTKLDQPYYQVDLTVNYWMARPELLVEIPQDERMKIGGEHGDWFLELKHQGKMVVWVPGVNINALPHNPTWQHRDYNQYRGRARTLGHTIFLQKRDITKYYGFDEEVIKPQAERAYKRRGDGRIVTVPRASAPAVKLFVPPDPVSMSDKAKPLIMVMTCKATMTRIEVIRNTWLQDAKDLGIDVRFFYGHGDDYDPRTHAYIEDTTGKLTVSMPVPDDYNHLPWKVQAAFKWAHDNGYTNALKLDDDTYAVPKVLLESGFEAHDYVGRVNHDPGGHYCSGGSGYWLSAKAMKVVAVAALDGDWAEDRVIGRILRNAGIKPHNDPRYTLYPFFGETLSHFCTACMIFDNLPKNRFVQPVSMAEMHKAFISTGSLPNVKY